MTGTEGAVELEVIGVVEEGPAHREQHLLQETAGTIREETYVPASGTFTYVSNNRFKNLI